MGAKQPESDVEATGRLDEMNAQMAVNRADIDELLESRDEADRRADEADARADQSVAQADEDRRRVSDLETRAAVDRELVAELHADGMLSQEHIAHLEEALRSSRTIGAAMGIIMAGRGVTEQEAFAVLKKASSLENRKLRLIAEDLVLTGDVDGLPKP
jgi:hypothetical protein